MSERIPGTRSPAKSNPGPWEFFDPPFVYYTESLITLFFFMEDPEFKRWELLCADGVNLSLILHGENGSLIYEQKIAKVKIPDRRRVIAYLQDNPKVMSLTMRKKLSETLRVYLGIEPL